MRVLLAYDGSSYGDVILEDLGRAGLPEKGELLVLSVAEYWLPPPSSLDVVTGAEPLTPAQRTEEVLRLAREMAGRAAQTLPGWELEAAAASGSPASVIVSKAGEWLSDLIVIGSHGLSGVERMILGSVSQKVVHDAPCSVRVARGSVRERGTPARIVIGFDGSEDAIAAAREVARRQWPRESEVRIVTSIGPFFPVRGAGAEEEKERARLMQQEAERVLRDSGLGVSSIIEEKDPRIAVVDQAGEWGADSIFVGTGGRGRLGRLLLGSVSAAIASRAGCAVEVVRHKEAADDLY